MRRIGNLILIGTSHIAKQSVKNVKEIIEYEQPDIIALELDPMRFYALTHKSKQRRLPSPFRVGFKGMLFSMFGAWAEKKLGDYVGVSPGTEMVTAGKLAKKLKKKIAFIDQNIEVTLRRLSQELTWKEKWRFAVDMIKGVFSKGEQVQIDLTKVPDTQVIDKLLKQVRQRYPNIYKVLIEERNTIMAMRLKQLIAKHPDFKIIAVVGAGHLEEIANIVEDVEDEPITYSYSFKTGL